MLSIVERVSFEVRAGEVIALIGESGSGKTTLGRVIAGLMPARSGEVSFQGRKLGGSVGERDREQLRAIQFAFQMADVALNPRHRVEKILSRPLSFYFGLGGRGRKDGSGSCWRWSSCPRATRRDTRDSSPAADGNGSASPARWPPSRS